MKHGKEDIDLFLEQTPKYHNLLDIGWMEYSLKKKGEPVKVCSQTNPLLHCYALLNLYLMIDFMQERPQQAVTVRDLLFSLNNEKPLYEKETRERFPHERFDSKFFDSAITSTFTKFTNNQNLLSTLKSDFNAFMQARQLHAALPEKVDTRLARHKI